MTIPSKRRYYIHGDKHETDAESFYCAECDVFFPESHFAEKHRVDNFSRYNDAAKNVSKLLKNSREHFRPDYPTNLFG